MDFTGDDGLPAAHHRGDRRARVSATSRGDVILPHERTLPKAEDRPPRAAARHPRQPRPDLGALPRHRALDPAAQPMPSRRPLATATDDDGFHHALWRIDDPERIEAIRAAVAGARARARRRPPPLRDRHHYRAERRAAGVDDPGADAIMALVVELAPEQLCVRAIHRLLDGVGGDRPARRAGRPVPSRRGRRQRARGRGRARGRACATSGGLGLVDRDGLALLRPGGRSWTPAWTTFPSELRDVDSARFDAGVLPAVPGGADSPTATTPRRWPRRSRRATPTPRCCCDRSPSTPIRAAAAADLRMPEKTTFFAPKPRTGMVFRSLD